MVDFDAINKTVAIRVDRSGIDSRLLVEWIADKSYRAGEHQDWKTAGASVRSGPSTTETLTSTGCPVASEGRKGQAVLFTV